MSIVSRYTNLTTSIDLQYVDPRSKERQAEDRLILDEINQQKAEKQQIWQSALENAQSAGLPEPQQEYQEQMEAIHPDWSQSPIEVSLSSYPLVPH
jgi:hypothetical protein